MKLKPQIYVKAAELVASGQPDKHEVSCRAILRVKKGDKWSGDDWAHCHERNAFEQFFGPHQVPLYNPAYWFGSNFNQIEQNERTLALLFMSQIAKDS